MDDGLVDFLRARLDEDKAAAEAATPGPWVANPYVDHDCDFEALIGTGSGVHDCGNVVGHGYEGGGVEKMADATHIARHDPARVLREVAAKRSAIREAFRHAAVVDGEWGCCHDAEQIERGECEEEVPSEMPILQALASVYADHPDYRPEWAPTT